MIEAKPFGNGIDVCPACGKPSTIGKPITNADRIRSITDEEMAELIKESIDCSICKMEVFDTITCPAAADWKDCYGFWLDWLKQEAI